MILGKVCIRVLGIYKLEAHGAIRGCREFAFQIKAKLLCSCLCLFDVIVELRAMDEKRLFNEFCYNKNC